jgi:glycosyltransferase involved in cell wall biosynthesis
VSASPAAGRPPAHVLLVDSSGYEDLGGASTVLDELIDRVDRARFVPALACLSPGRWPELVRARGTAAYSLPRTRLRSPANLATLVLGLRGALRHERSDLVHASENTALLYASLAGRLTGTPVVWHIHSPLRPRGRTERAVVRVLRALPPAHIVFTSEGAQRRTVAFPGVAWSVITPGVDLAECAGGDAARGRRAFGIPDDARVISMFARIEPMKGQVDFVRCLGRLAATRDDVYGVMCGPPDRTSPYWARLQALVHELHLEERLIIPGDVRPPLKHDVVAASDVVVHPSHAESFGLAVLEAMAGGKAVVAAATDGPRLMIEDGVDGVLVEPGDVDALASAVGRLLDDDGARRRIGAAAMRAAERHGVDDMVRKFEELWDAVLGRAPTG